MFVCDIISKMLKVKAKLGQTGVLFLLALFLSTAVIQLFVTNQKIYAGPIDEAFRMTGEQVDKDVAIRVIRKCFKNEPRVHLNDYDVLHSKHWHDAVEHIGVVSGSFTTQNADNGNKEINCRNESQMNSVFRVLGFNNVGAFMRHFYPTGSNNRNCTDNHCPLNVDNDNDLVNRLRFITIKLEERVDLRLNRGNVDYLKALRTFENGQCKGKYTNSVSGIPSENYLGGDPKTKVNARTGEIDRFDYATFDIPHGTNLQDTGTNHMFGGDPTCVQLARKVSELSVSMRNFVGGYQLNCAPTNSNRSNFDYCDEPEQGVGDNNPAVTREEGEEDNSCESASGPLGWIMCPIAGILDSAVGFLDEQITSALYLKDDYFAGESGDKLRESWVQIRNIAYIILIPIMLVMVIGTALGFEIFSAYTIKKALPRMVIAIIFITLSWYICLFIVNFTNVVGAGIKGLITSPFEIDPYRSGLKDALDSAGVTQAGDGWVQAGLSGAAVGVIGVAGVAAGFLSGALSLGIIMSTLATAALILGAIFLLLIARQMILIALFLIAPLAILSWIFPGNDKLWKLWWSSFSKLLLLFPLIMLLIGVGQVFASVTGAARSGAGENQLITTIIIIAAYVMPFFFIPFAFKWAGGLFANLAGMVNDRERGLLDRLKKGRAEKREKLRGLAGNNRRFNPSGRLGRLNNAAGWIADPMNSAKIKFGTAGGRALASELTQKSAAQSQDLAKWMSNADFNQEAATAIMEAYQEGGGKLTKQALDNKIAKLKEGGTQDRAAANILEGSGAFLLNTYQSEEFGRADIGMAAGYVKASQGFMNSKDPDELANYANFLNSKTPGLGDTFKTQAGLMAGQGGGLGKVGYSEQVDRDGNYVAGGTAARAIQLARSGVQDIAGTKSGQLKQHFLGEGKALDQIMKTDGFSDVATGESITIDNEKRKAVMDNIAQAAYGYNTPAETAAVLRAEIARLKEGHTVIENVTDKDGKVIGQREVGTTDLGRMLLNSEAQARRATSEEGRRAGAEPAADPE